MKVTTMKMLRKEEELKKEKKEKLMKKRKEKVKKEGKRKKKLECYILCDNHYNAINWSC